MQNLEAITAKTWNAAGVIGTYVRFILLHYYYSKFSATPPESAPPLNSTKWIAEALHYYNNNLKHFKRELPSLKITAALSEKVRAYFHGSMGKRITNFVKDCKHVAPQDGKLTLLKVLNATKDVTALRKKYETFLAWHVKIGLNAVQITKKTRKCKAKPVESEDESGSANDDSEKKQKKRKKMKAALKKSGSVKINFHGNNGSTAEGLDSGGGQGLLSGLFDTELKRNQLSSQKMVTFLFHLFV